MSVDGRTARRLSTRVAILTAASEAFAEQGYASTSMDDVAAAAGVSKGTLFYHFGGKTELFTEVLRGTADRLVQTWVEEVGTATGWQALEAGARGLLTAVDTSPQPVRLLVTELFRPSRPWSSDLARIRDQVLAPLVEVLEHVHAERSARFSAVPPADLDRFRTTAAALLGALCFTALDHQAFSPDLPLEQVHASLMQAIGGLRP